MTFKKCLNYILTILLTTVLLSTIIYQMIYWMYYFDFIWRKPNGLDLTLISSIICTITSIVILSFNIYIDILHFILKLIKPKLILIIAISIVLFSFYLFLLVNRYSIVNDKHQGIYKLDRLNGKLWYINKDKAIEVNDYKEN